MIDTLKHGHAAVQLDTNVASVTLQDITFDQDLWKPLYPSLFDYDAAPTGLNLVPSFQVKTLEISSMDVTLELKQDQPFEIQSDLSMFWRVVNGPEATVTSLSVTSKSCVLRIDLTDPDLKVLVFQVLCRKTGQTEFSGKEEIEGGLFFSIVNEPGVAMEPIPDPGPLPPSGKIWVTEIGAQGRPHYNIFNPSVYTGSSIVSTNLEPEPAVRVHQAEPLNVKITLVPEHLFFLARASHPGEIAIEMHEPEEKPSALNVDFLSDDEGGLRLKGCDIQWLSSSDPERRNYLVTSFSAEIHSLTSEAIAFLKEKGWDGAFDLKLLKLISIFIEGSELRRTFPAVGGVDPTIIDTPTCTEINGRVVCSA